MINSIKTDFIGAGASMLCLIHCIATPFLFIAKSCSATCCAETPVWWKAIDILFLGVSFFAIYQSAKNSTSKKVVAGMWFSWAVLALIIINEYAMMVTLSKYIIYLPAIALIILHLINLKYCQCTNNTCCAN